MINLNEYTVQSFRDFKPLMITTSKEYHSSWKKLSMSLIRKDTLEIAACICLNRVDKYPQFGVAGCRILSLWIAPTVDANDVIIIIKHFLWYIKMYRLDIYGANYCFNYIWAVQETINSNIIFDAINSTDLPVIINDKDLLLILHS